MTLAREHLRFAAIARVQGDEEKRLKHLRLAEESQEACDSGRCGCAVKCKSYTAAFNGWAYAEGYFQQKWAFGERLAGLKARLANQDKSTGVPGPVPARAVGPGSRTQSGDEPPISKEVRNG